MAEYCSQCNSSPYEEVDIDLVEIALNLDYGRSESFICEGCNNRALFKDNEGCLFIGKSENGELVMRPVKIEEL